MSNPLFRRLAQKAETLEDIEFLETYQEIESEEKVQMAERKFSQRGIALWLVALVIALIVMAIMAVTGVEASGTQYWMVLHEGYNGLNFSCAATNPYADISEMTVEQYTPYALHPNDLDVRMQIIEVAYCNLDVVYEGQGDDYDFVWRFTERVTDGHQDHVHFTRGAAWIQLLVFEEVETNP